MPVYQLTMTFSQSPDLTGTLDMDNDTFQPVCNPGAPIVDVQVAPDGKISFTVPTGQGCPHPDSYTLTPTGITSWNPLIINGSFVIDGGLPAADPGTWTAEAEGGGAE